jgi:hypothetical protein
MIFLANEKVYGVAVPPNGWNSPKVHLYTYLYDGEGDKCYVETPPDENGKTIKMQVPRSMLFRNAQDAVNHTVAGFERVKENIDITIKILKEMKFE